MNFREQIDEYKLKGAEYFRGKLPEIISRAEAPDSKEDYINFAVDICIDLKNYEKAIELLKLKESRFHLTDIGHNLLAFCYWELEQEDAAYRNYEQSVALNSQNVSSLRGACFLAIETGHDKEAIEHCRLFYEKSAESHEAAIWYGTALCNLDKKEELLELIRDRERKYGPDTELENLLES